MNQKLMEQIILHILSNLGIVKTHFVSANETKSIMDKQFLLSEKLTFETVEGDILRKNIYGSQISVSGSKDFKLLLADCTQEKDFPEYGLVIQLKDAPTYGLYFVFNNSEAEALIAVNTDKKHWIPCSTYLQATFLAGMEQLRDLGFGWKKCIEYKELHSQLLTFIKFHDSYFEAQNTNHEQDNQGEMPV